MNAMAIAREQAIAALVHRLNGGLHNAALALELAADGGSNSSLLGSGIAGIEQASRAGAMLDALVRQGARDDAPGPYLDDVVELLRIEASRRSIELRPSAIAVAPSETTARAAVQGLVDGLAMIASAAAGTRVLLELGTSGRGSALRVEPAAD